ncbi:MAG TPA: ATP-binding protein [Gemmatimonadaceae bacterium]|jgi:PAS domain S-box-containing protein|nr:ATP-binding protein [Gemmatimonadaceae bacterium]
MIREIQRLRIALRDLVALSTLPAAWAGRDPATIAAGLTDVLASALQLDFVFVRLLDRNGGAPVEVTKGNGWSSFPTLVDAQLGALTRKPRKDVITNLGDCAQRYRALISPIGFDGVGGMVAVASDRPNFPTDTEHLLLSVATNHAALAFQSAQLVQDLRIAEEELVRARDDLETKVTERTGELRRTSAELQAILDASPVGMVLLRADRTVLRCNAAFERLFGWRADEVVGRRTPLTDAIGHQATPMGTCRYSPIEIRMTRKDGSEFDAALACAPLVGDEGHTAGLVANVVDISDRKRAEEGQRKAEAELAHVTRLTTLGEMAASIAHEINQPLTAIVANATASRNWLMRPERGLDRVHDALADIVNDGHRAAEVIQRVRQLATKSDPKKGDLDVNEVIHEVATLMRSEMQTQRVDFGMSLARGLPVVLADRVQLQQVIINLVVNGVESMAGICDRPRELFIRSEACEDRVAVSVHDSGVGVDMRVVDRLFDAFYTTKPRGMGMGLSISRSIIEGHGGRLWVTPNANHGATFQFALPAKP